MYISIDEVLEEGKDFSDIILRSEKNPVFKSRDSLKSGSFRISEKQLKGWLLSLIPDERYSRFIEDKSIDLSYVSKDKERYRVNIYFQKSRIAAVFRHLKNRKTRSFEDLGLPDATLKSFIAKRAGLILVSGAASQGKTTTLAAMVREILKRKQVHVITIEDPIEYELKDDKGIISQREIGKDTPSFEKGLKDALREAPEVIVVGELRSPNEAEICLYAAETGHLVLATMHASHSIQAVQKFLDWFPDKQSYILKILTSSLVGVIYQSLIKKEDSQILAYEILSMNEAMRQILSRGDFSSILAEVSKNRDGNITLNQSILKLIKSGTITFNQGAIASYNASELTRMMKI